MLGGPTTIFDEKVRRNATQWNRQNDSAACLNPDKQRNRPFELASPVRRARASEILSTPPRETTTHFRRDQRS